METVAGTLTRRFRRISGHCLSFVYNVMYFYLLHRTAITCINISSLNLGAKSSINCCQGFDKVEELNKPEQLSSLRKDLKVCSAQTRKSWLLNGLMFDLVTQECSHVQAEHTKNVAAVITQKGGCTKY